MEVKVTYKDETTETIYDVLEIETHIGRIYFTYEDCDTTGKVSIPFKAINEIKIEVKEDESTTHHLG